MKYFFIEPLERSIREFDHKIDESLLQGLLGGRPSLHYLIPMFIPHHEGWVDGDGLVRKKPMWYFHGVNVWGSMVICGEHFAPAYCSETPLRALVSFDNKIG